MFDPKKRVTVQDVLAHPYLEAYVRLYSRHGPAPLTQSRFALQHDPDDEPCAPPLDPEFFEFDRQCSRAYSHRMR